MTADADKGPVLVLLEADGRGQAYRLSPQGYEAIQPYLSLLEAGGIATRAAGYVQAGQEASMDAQMEELLHLALKVPPARRAAVVELLRASTADPAGPMGTCTRTPLLLMLQTQPAVRRDWRGNNVLYCGRYISGALVGMIGAMLEVDPDGQHGWWSA